MDTPICNNNNEVYLKFVFQAKHRDSTYHYQMVLHKQNCHDQNSAAPLLVYTTPHQWHGCVFH